MISELKPILIAFEIHLSKKMDFRASHLEI